MTRRYAYIRIPKTGSKWLNRFIRRADAVRVERRRADSAAFRRLHDAMPKHLAVWAAGGRQLARVSDFHVPWSRIPGWLKMLPVVYSLRDVLGWHVSRWLHITNATTPDRMLDYVRRNNSTDPDGSFPWKLSDHQRLVEEYLGGEFSLASWCGLSAEGYWFFTQRINVTGTIRSRSGVRPEWPGIGFYTMRILLMIHRNPDRLFRLSEPELEEYFASGRWRDDICRGWCVGQAHLKEDACRVLENELGYRREDLERALASMPEKVNETDLGRKERARRGLRENAALCDGILHAERLTHQYILPMLTGMAPAAATGLSAFASLSGAAVPSEASASSEA